MTDKELLWWMTLEQQFYPLRDFIELHVDAAGPTIEQRRVRFATTVMNKDIADMLLMLHAAAKRKVDHVRCEFIHAHIKGLIDMAKSASSNKEKNNGKR